MFFKKNAQNTYIEEDTVGILKKREPHKILRVDSDNIEFLPDDIFDLFVDSFRIKYRAMCEKRMIGKNVDEDVVINDWCQDIVDMAIDYPYLTTYFIYYNESIENTENITLAIVRNEFSVFRNLHGMKLMELYVSGIDYEVGYNNMVKYLNKVYAPYDKTIFKPFSYQSKAHMIMGYTESIY